MTGKTFAKRREDSPEQQSPYLDIALENSKGTLRIILLCITPNSQGDSGTLSTLTKKSRGQCCKLKVCFIMLLHGKDYR